MSTPDAVEWSKPKTILMYSYTIKSWKSCLLLILIYSAMHACCSVTLLCPYLSRPCIKGSTGSTVDFMPHINSRHPGMAPQTRGIRHWMLGCRLQQLAGGRHGLMMQYLRHKVNSTGHDHIESNSTRHDHIESFVLLLLGDLNTQTHQAGCLYMSKKKNNRPKAN